MGGGCAQPAARRAPPHGLRWTAAAGVSFAGLARVVLLAIHVPTEEMAPLNVSLRPYAAAACAAAALVLTACDRPVLPAPAEAPAPKPNPADAAKPAPADTADTAERASAEPPLVELPAGPPSDAQITARATQALRADPALAGTDLSVTTTHGVVSVTGTVRSPEQVAIAEKRAQSPTGVMRVETHVSVTPG